MFVSRTTFQMSGLHAHHPTWHDQHMVINSIFPKPHEPTRWVVYESVAPAGPDYLST
jgi:hypothetical protein